MDIVLADISHDSLKPLTYTRSVSDVEVGGATVFEHVERELDAENYSVLVPEYLEEVTRKNSELYGLERDVNQAPDEEYVLYNASVIPDEEVAHEIEELEPGEAVFQDDTFIAGLTDRDLDYGELGEELGSFESNETGGEPLVIEYPWDLYSNNGELIERRFPGAAENGDVHGDATVRGEELYLEEGASVDPEAVIDATEGPVYIDEDAEIGSQAWIQGPVYIGPEASVEPQSAVYGDTHIGEAATIGGEVKKSVVHSFSNKAHHGFLGRSIVGSWSNLGAGTTNSDLKNTFGNVSVEHPVDGEVEAGTKVGATVGDHSKTDIGTMIYTGKVAGPVATLSSRVTGNVEPFTFTTPDGSEVYVPEKAVEHAENMMERKESRLPEGYIEAQKELIEHLSEEF